MPITKLQQPGRTIEGGAEAVRDFAALLETQTVTASLNQETALEAPILNFSKATPATANAAQHGEVALVMPSTC